jgi:hypothetical protein
MLHKKPMPLFTSGKSRRLCPVCGTASYSRYGIHPQCAQQQADAPRVERLRAERKASERAAAAGVDAALAWQKRCPICGQHVPSRKMTCGCGHAFG